MIIDVFLALGAVGTLIGGLGTWRGSRDRKAIRKLEQDTSWARLAQALEENDRLRSDLRILRAECRRLARQLQAALQLVEQLRGASS